MEQKKKILLTYIATNTFVTRDYNSLSKRYDVDLYQVHLSKNVLILFFQLLKQLFFLLIKGYRYDVLYTWFVDYHSYLPTLFSRLFKKKSVLIIGGFDAVSIPEIEFGLFYKPLRLRFYMAKRSYQYGKYIVPVDDTLIKSTNYYIDEKGLKIGFLNYVENVKGRIITVPTGYKAEYWKRMNLPLRGDIITVGSCKVMKVFKRKGHDFLLEVARTMPDLKFTMIGIDESIIEKIKDQIPSNVKIMSFVQQDELRDLFSSHRVFTQFSLSEGLPNTLCEAMMCGCIPVGSNVNGIPLAIGDTGIVINRRDTNEAKAAIRNALKIENRMLPRERIINLFPENRREEKLFEVVEE